MITGKGVSKFKIKIILYVFVCFNVLFYREDIIKKMKILVTGGCGFVGANISLFLKKKGFKVSSIDNLTRRGSLFNLELLKKSKILNYKFNINNYSKIKNLPRFDIIIDCCA